MPETPRLALPLLAAGQSQKDVTHNDALLAIDRLVTLAVESRGVTAPPVSPNTGAVWIVPADGAADWEQAAGTLMHWLGNGWLAQTPRSGQMAMVVDEAVLLVYAGGWHLVRHLAAPAAFAMPSGGVTVDSEARMAIVGLVTVLQQQGLLV
ncbi:DUF2793 domain-containing protein [Sandarakinorhabdus sp.]|uniref:DUF2793 domain-containing protein n=1 Tax=Sandarakinorhabdus sp. TaxID=1916663 RepID=UPI003F70185F